jgi:hypothetical protein
VSGKTYAYLKREREEREYTGAVGPEASGEGEREQEIRAKIEKE